MTENLRAPALAVVTHDSVSHVSAFLGGQAAVAEALGTVLVVVDNASTDGSRPFLRRFAGERSHVVLRENHRNLGYAAAINQAFALTGDHDVLALNPDVRLDRAEDVLALAQVLAEHDDVGIVAPGMRHPDGEIQSSARPWPSVLAMGGHASALRRLPVARAAADDYLALPKGEAPVFVDWVTGAAMLVRRKAYVDAAGWDERFFLYMEDCDFCLRCAALGWRTAYVPSLSLLHLHIRASGTGSILTSRHRRAHIASMVRFFAKYPRLAIGR